MKVADLITQLSKCDQNADVLIMSESSMCGGETMAYLDPNVESDWKVDGNNSWPVVVIFYDDRGQCGLKIYNTLPDDEEMP